jgi:hypothetical protein
MYEVEWTEVKKHKARVLVPSDDAALKAALGTSPELIAWVEADSNPVVSNGPTEITVTQLGRIQPDGSVKPL